MLSELLAGRFEAPVLPLAHLPGGQQCHAQTAVPAAVHDSVNMFAAGRGRRGGGRGGGCAAQSRHTIVENSHTLCSSCINAQ